MALGRLPGAVFSLQAATWHLSLASLGADRDETIEADIVNKDGPGCRGSSGSIWSVAFMHFLSWWMKATDGEELRNKISKDFEMVGEVGRTGVHSSCWTSTTHEHLAHPIPKKVVQTSLRHARTCCHPFIQRIRHFAFTNNYDLFFFCLSFRSLITLGKAQQQGPSQGMSSCTGRGPHAIFDRFSLNFREFRTLASLPVLQSHFSPCFGDMTGTGMSPPLGRFLQKKWAKFDMRGCLLTLYFKSILKKNQSKVFSSQTLLAKGTKMKSLASPVFKLKALEFGPFFAYFYLFRYLKVVQLFQNCAETFRFNKLSNKKDRLKIALQVSKLASSSIVMP